MSQKSIMERVQTVEDAFKETGRPEVDFSNVPEDLRKFFEGMYKAVVVTEALNEGKKPDWDNDNQQKWFPWFWMSPARFRFDVTVYVDTNASAGSGSRLCSFDRETARYSATQFADLWKDVQIG